MNDTVSSIRLVCSPGVQYLEALEGALAGATSVTLVTAFATAAGFERLVEPLRRVLASPTGQVQLVVAVDRQRFNTEPLFRSLLELRNSCGSRMSIGLVPQTMGLLHAKALLATGTGGTTLVVGSANLTADALSRNHELGLVVHGPPADIVKAFRRFVVTLSARTLDENVLEKLGYVSKAEGRSEAQARVAAQSWRELVATIQGQSHQKPLPADPATAVASWIEQGYLVGRGRRGTDALVLRVPLDQLELRGLVETKRRRSLGGGARESRTVGYQVELLPPTVAEEVRAQSRRVTRLLTRLCLNLPCFGLWMPETYWDVFVDVRERLLRGPALSHERVEAAATVQRRRLLEKRGLEEDLELILESMVHDGVLQAGSRRSVHEHLLPELRGRLTDRRPELIANAIQFRTARQRWTPFESTEAPYRQLMVDVVQAVLSATLRTGDWPRRFQSLAARELALAFSRKLAGVGRDADGATAQEMLDQSGTWEHPARSFTRVVEEFRTLVPLDHEFVPPDPDELLSEEEERED